MSFYSAMKGSLYGLWRAFIFRRETRASQIAMTRLACHAYRENFPIMGVEACIEGFTLKGTDNKTDGPIFKSVRAPG